MIIANIDLNIILFLIKTGKITRGHDFLLEKAQSRLDVREYSIYLPEDRK